MKTNLLIAGIFAVGVSHLLADQTAQDILTLNANDTPVVVDSISTTTPNTTSGTATGNANGPGYVDNNIAFLQLSLTPELALEPRTTIIDGISLGIWNENPQHGIALGIINGSTGNSSGFSWGIINYDDTYKGVQWGIVNYSREYFVGWQRGWVNISRGDFYGFQWAFVNLSEHMTGLQLGVVNYASDLTGVQIGLVNVAANNAWFSDFPRQLSPVFPFFNWSF